MMGAIRPQGDYCNLPCNHDYCRGIWAEHAANTIKYRGDCEYAYKIKLPTRQNIVLCLNLCLHGGAWTSSPKYEAGVIERETGYRVCGGQGGYPVKYSWQHRLDRPWMADLSPILKSIQSAYYFERDVARAVIPYKIDTVRCGVCRRHRHPYTLNTLISNRWDVGRHGHNGLEGQYHRDCDDLLIWRLRISDGAPMSDELERIARELKAATEDLAKTQYSFNDARDKYFDCRVKDEKEAIRLDKDRLLVELRRLGALEQRLHKTLMLNYAAKQARERKKWLKLKRNQRLLTGIKKALRQGQTRDALRSLQREYTTTGNSRRS